MLLKTAHDPIKISHFVNLFILTIQFGSVFAKLDIFIFKLKS